MRRVIDGQTIDGPTDRGGTRIENLEFHRCYFEGAALSVSRDPGRRTTVRNVHLVGCEQRGCTVYVALLESVLVDGLKTNGLLQCWGAAFRNVTLRGKIERLMISHRVAPGVATAEEQRAFDRANRDYYASVDWALDISEGAFNVLDIRGVPSDLIRRDSLTQAVVRREKVLDGAWRRLDLSKTYWAEVIETMLRDGYPDAVLVAPRKPGRKTSDLMDGIARLRDAGIAEVD